MPFIQKPVVMPTNSIIKQLGIDRNAIIAVSGLKVLSAVVI